MIQKILDIIRSINEDRTGDLLNSTLWCEIQCKIVIPIKKKYKQT